MNQNNKIVVARNLTRKDIVKLRYLQECCVEKSLWKSVICQAIEDATSKSALKRSQRLKTKAKSWLIDENEDFRAVCQLAGYCHVKVRNNALRLIR